MLSIDHLKNRLVFWQKERASWIRVNQVCVERNQCTNDAAIAKANEAFDMVQDLEQQIADKLKGSKL